MPRKLGQFLQGIGRGDHSTSDSTAVNQSNQAGGSPVRGSAVCSTKAYCAGTTCCSSTAMYRSEEGREASG